MLFQTRKNKKQTLNILASFLMLGLLCTPQAGAEDIIDDELVVPKSLKELERLERENTIIEDNVMPIDIRKEAIKEAALSYGARGGLAWGTYHTRMRLDKRARYMDRVFDFGQLLVSAPSGLLIEPPVISESTNAMIIEYGAQEAAVSDKVYNIITNAQIVSTPRTWRDYLQRDWGLGEVKPPPDILRPENDEERELWIEHVNLGWEQGIIQADEIFEDSINLLTADFQGMVRYRSLLSQGMVSPPYALQIDRGVTGDGDVMRIGDRAVQITGVPQLITGSDAWKPANR